SLLAGHPQTSLFTLYLALAFLAYRQWSHADQPGGLAARRWLLAAALMGLVAGGLAAVQLLPGLEYLRHTSREALSFDAKGNGFPFMDVAQVLFPGFISLWSPLYVGIAGLALAVLAIVRRAAHSAFFGIAALVGLILSFGAGTVIYDLAYLVVPGVSWFRGQERAAFVVAQSAAVLAGLGAAHVLAWSIEESARKTVRRALIGLFTVCAVFAAALFVLWTTPDRASYEDALRSASFATLLAALAAAVIPWAKRGPAPALALVALVVFDLFSVTMGGPNFDPVPAGDRLPEPVLITELRADLPPGARVDGVRGVRENYGTLYSIPDIRTISPLRLKGVEAILALPDDRAWDLLAVRYVLTDWEELTAPSTIIATSEDPYGPYNVHLLDSPRDFAHLVYAATVVAGDEEAYGLLREPAFDARAVVLLDSDPGVMLPDSAPDDPGRAVITRFEPERITIQVETASAAILTLALPDYPGWQATLNGDQADILRAYGGLSAVALPGAGAHTVELTFRPWTFRLGAAISGIMLLAMCGLAAVGFWRSRSAGQKS
ncbi:MAG: YfhO family protein, partial [Anaerolineae bacterium]|nr:YfhO family protein [Anaerolineae bacterium]